MTSCGACAARAWWLVIGQREQANDHVVPAVHMRSASIFSRSVVIGIEETVLHQCVFVRNERQSVRRHDVTCWALSNALLYHCCQPQAQTAQVEHLTFSWDTVYLPLQLSHVLKIPQTRRPRLPYVKRKWRATLTRFRTTPLPGSRTRKAKSQSRFQLV